MGSVVENGWGIGGGQVNDSWLSFPAILPPALMALWLIGFGVMANMPAPTEPNALQMRLHPIFHGIGCLAALHVTYRLLFPSWDDQIQGASFLFAAFIYAPAAVMWGQP